MLSRAFRIGQHHVPHLDAAFLQDDARSQEGLPPDGIFEGWSGGLDAGDPGIDDRPRAIDAGKEGRRQPAPGRGMALPCGGEDGVALGVLHPDEAAVALVPLGQIVHPGGKGVAGGDDGPLVLACRA